MVPQIISAVGELALKILDLFWLSKETSLKQLTDEEVADEISRIMNQQICDEEKERAIAEGRDAG